MIVVTLFVKQLCMAGKQEKQLNLKLNQDLITIKISLIDEILKKLLELEFEKKSFHKIKIFKVHSQKNISHSIKHGSKNKSKARN